MKKYIASPEAGGEFLLPCLRDNQWQLVGHKSGQSYRLGVVVFVGKDIVESDVFARVVDAGHQIPSVENLLRVIGDLLAFISAAKVGHSLGISSVGQPYAA